MGDVPDLSMPGHGGHRARLRGRLLKGGGEALLDHELIEYLLALALPRRDTKPMAKALLRHFGCYAAVVQARPADLLRFGLTEGTVGALKIAEASAIRMLKSGFSGRPVLSSWAALIDYLSADMGHLPIERVRLLLLNTKNILIRDELLSEGAVDQAPVYAREVIRRAIEHHATGMILVHNHPSGDTRPSREDIAMTRAVAESGKLLGIALHDHVIVGSTGHSSFKALGLL